MASSKAEARAAARAKAAAQRAAAARARKRRRTAVIAGGVVGALVVVGIAAGLIVHGTQAGAVPRATASTGAVSAARSAADGRTTAPPWAAPADVDASVRAAGLHLLTSEGTALHIHQHLSIAVNGKAVAVPAGLGIDEARGISALHTHDTSGILHVESPVAATFHLDQAFAEWDVRLGRGEIGPYVNGENGTRETVFVNGKAYSGDPRDIVLTSHEDIDFVVTTDGSAPKAPAAFVFPQGD